MTVGEIVDRVGDARRRRLWRRRPPTWPLMDDDQPLTALPGLRARLASAIELAGVQQSLERLEQGQLAFLGRAWPACDATDPGAAFWLHDPVTGGRWPGAEKSSFDVDVRSTTHDGLVPRTFGDVKFVWEPNRLQVLHPLAVAAAAGRVSASGTALAILRSWARTNPPYAGVNWVSGIEIALRLVGVALMCIATDAWDIRDRAFLRGFIYAHAAYLEAFPSRHSSANNHLIAEGLGLLLAGLLMPELAAHAAEGRRIIEREAERQILADGVGAEQSPTYQAFSMEMLALAVLLCREVGRPLAPLVTTRLVAGAAFLGALMDEAGRVPAIGDDDEGRVIAQPPDREPRYVASIVAAVAGLADRPDLMPPARDAHLRDALFDVRCPGAPLALGRRSFRDGGYTVSRDRIGGRIATLVFDHGPLGYLALCAHGHADALAVWLTVGDDPILIDSGTYLYFAGGGERTRLRESLAHNTVSLMGASQSIAAPAFSWVHRAAAGIASETPEPDWSLAGWHDGFARRFGVRHERRISRIAEGYLVEDRLAGAGLPRQGEIRFHLAAALEATRDARAVLVGKNGRPLCRILAPDGFATSLQDCEYSPCFGALETIRRIVLSGLFEAAPITTRIEIL